MYQNKNSNISFLTLGVDQATFMLASLILFLIASVFRLVTSLILIIAAYTNNRKLTLPWLVIDMVSRVIDICLFISAIVLKDMWIALLTPLRIGD